MERSTVFMLLECLLAFVMCVDICCDILVYCCIPYYTLEVLCDIPCALCWLLCLYVLAVFCSVHIG